MDTLNLLRVKLLHESPRHWFCLPGCGDQASFPVHKTIIRGEKRQARNLESREKTSQGKGLKQTKDSGQGPSAQVVPRQGELGSNAWIPRKSGRNVSSGSLATCLEIVTIRANG